MTEFSENGKKISLGDLVVMAEKLTAAGRIKDAIEAYRDWIATSKESNKHLAYFNLGALFNELNDFETAMQHFETATNLNPNFVQAYINLANALEKLSKPDMAIEQNLKALETQTLKSDKNNNLKIHVLNNLGRLYGNRHRLKEALEMLEESAMLNPDQPEVLLNINHWSQRICRWPIHQTVKGVEKKDLVRWTSPLTMLAHSDDPEAQLEYSRHFVNYKFIADAPQPFAPAGNYNHDRLKIGYLSSNLSTHAVSMLTVDLFENHDRNLFEVYAFCWSKEDQTAFRNRVIQSFDKCFKIDSMTDRQAAEFIRSQEIDILVDLQGLTSGARPYIAAYRPAPVQATYLGFPGTNALPWIDYVIADRYLIPEKEAQFYSEKPIYLDNCFQSSDSQRVVGKMPTRKDYNLPDEGFIFCSFNNNYKFRPDMFDAWMRILKRVPKSVLWLLSDNQWSLENLLKCARKQGIARERIIFGGRVLPQDYLARYQLADLFLDTYPFNGGTTANDALFMGLPLLTLSGRTFAARMAGSLLNHLGLNELITTSLKKYENRAVELAQNPQKLADIKKQLLTAKQNSRVFNMRLFARDYEKALLKLFPDFRKSTAINDQEQRSLLVKLEAGSDANTFEYQLLLSLAKESNIRLFFHLPETSECSLTELDAKAFKHARIRPWNREKLSATLSSYCRENPGDVSNKSLVLFANTSELEQISEQQAKDFENGNKLLIVHSEWSRKQLIEKGFSAGKIFVVPPAIDSRIFCPLSDEVRNKARAGLDYLDDNIVFINLGPADEKNGLDLVLKAFFTAFPANPKIRLLLSDARSPEGQSVNDLIQELAKAGKIKVSAASIAAMRLIPGKLSKAQINSLFNIADFYLAPYRQSDFNMPVMEAIAAGTPVIVTGSGSTEEFCMDHTALKISVKPGSDGKNSEPEFDHLLELVNACSSGDYKFDPVRFSFGRCDMLQKFNWTRTSNLVSSLF